MGWLTIIAIAVGPFLGIWANGKLQDRKTAYQRKLDIFKTLMATRATPLARAHVESLNRIDIEFTGRKGRTTCQAWAVLLEHYGKCPTQPSNPPLTDNQVVREQYNTDKQSYLNSFDRWFEKIIELRTTLLKEMGDILGFPFDELKIKNAVYHPKLHGDVDEQQLSLLAAANDVLRADRPLAMYIVNWPNQTEPSG